MTLARILLAAALAAPAVPARAQLSNRSISVETGLSAALDAPGGTREAFALAATAWLDGELEAVARVVRWAAPRTEGRAPDGGGWAGTAGLRLSLAPAPLRPQLWIEAGWAQVEGPEGEASRLALGAGAGLEWFVVRDVSIAARCALRGAGSARAVDVLAGLAAYF